MKNSLQPSKELGQTFMPDYLASLLIFGILLTIFLSSWNSVLSDQTEFQKEDQLRRQGSYTTTFLVTTPGYPEDWNSSNVEIPGFAEPDNVLQAEKLEEFRSLSYQKQKVLLQAPDFYMTVENETSVLELNGAELEYGQDYSGAGTVFPFTRNVRVNLSGQMRTAQLRYVVWT